MLGMSTSSRMRSGVRRRASIMAAVKDELDALAAEFAPLMDAANASRDTAKATAVDAVKAAGETVKGDRLMLVYGKPRETWDTKALTGYAAAHPEIERFKKVGEPTVTVRTM
jgi:hypothetical protein